MIFLCDIGNSNVSLGLSTNKSVLARLDYPSHSHHAVNDHSSEIRKFLKSSKVHTRTIAGCIVSSVVPGCTGVVMDALKSVIGKNVIVTEPGMQISMKLHYRQPQTLGADRIAALHGARNYYRYPALITDFGSATTLSLLDAEGNFAGGMILPGINMLRYALRDRTGQLPLVEFTRPDRLIGISTEENIQAGLYWGAIYGLEKIVMQIQESYDTLEVIATGGHAEVMHRELRCLDILDRNLVFKGLSVLYELNSGFPRSGYTWEIA